MLEEIFIRGLDWDDETEKDVKLSHPPSLILWKGSVELLVHMYEKLKLRFLEASEYSFRVVCYA